MKPDADSLRALLHEVLPSSPEQCGPAADDVVRVVREERRRRQRTRRTAALLAGVAALVSAALWRHGQAIAPPMPVARATPQRAPLVIHQINDEQLFTLLKDTPAALVKSPDGTSRLLIIEQ